MVLCKVSRPTLCVRSNIWLDRGDYAPFDRPCLDIRPQNNSHGSTLAVVVVVVVVIRVDQQNDLGGEAPSTERIPIVTTAATEDILLTLSLSPHAGGINKQFDMCDARKAEEVSAVVDRRCHQKRSARCSPRDGDRLTTKANKRSCGQHWPGRPHQTRPWQIDKKQQNV
jgi:hypothetical protein